METKQFKIAGAESSIAWTGRKVTGAHDGTIVMKEGTINVTDGKLSGGNFIIDTTSIKILDITDPDTNKQFAGHLASEDFFAIEKFPSAAFEITSVTQTSGTSYHVDGTLTIKGITHPNGFDTEIIIGENEINASGKMIVDRTKYDMKFRSGNFFLNLGDTLIYNDFELDVKIIAKAA